MKFKNLQTAKNILGVVKKNITAKKVMHGSVLLVSFLIISFMLFINFFPVKALFSLDIAETTKIYDRNGVLLYETLYPEKGRTTELELDQISDFLIDATIAVEDKNFYNHSGVDIEGIARAIYLNIKEGQIVSGGSTITQQLIRNLIGTDKKRTLFQKVKETFLAIRLERVLSKDEILHLYLNTIYYGNLNYGVGAASYGYFGKHVSDLDLAESAFLAGLPQAPNRYDPFDERQAAIDRKNHVLELMEDHGTITDTEYNEAKNEALNFELNLVEVKAPHFVNYVLGELESQFGSSFISEGLHIKTSMDYSMYEKVQEISRANLDLLIGRNVTNASVVVLDPKTADILVMMGSVDYFDTEIDGNVNVAIQARQPGSAIKPITYSVAFEQGWHGATLIEDEPVRFFTADGNPYYPKNYDYEYHGIVSLREALANSYNIPAVLTIEYAGVENVLNKAREMGLETLDQSADHYGLALTLGDGEVRLLDLSSVYMTFDNGGFKKDLRSILEIYDNEGELIFESIEQTGESVLGEDIAFMITDILSDTEARLPEFGDNNVLELDRPAAVKTGTTRDFRDNWTMGYTPDYVVGVWVGNNDNSQMRDVSGIDGAGPIWHDVMQEIHLHMDSSEFEVPASVEQKNFNGTLEWVSTLQNYSDSPTLISIPEIEIKTPFDLDTYQIQSSIPIEYQQISLEVKLSGSEEKVLELEEQLEWWINDEYYGNGNNILWKLSYGEFTIQAESGNLESEEILIYVE
jgi:penicillin-binding protein 1C